MKIENEKLNLGPINAAKLGPLKNDQMEIIQNTIQNITMYCEKDKR